MPKKIRDPEPITPKRPRKKNSHKAAPERKPLEREPQKPSFKYSRNSHHPDPSRLRLGLFRATKFGGEFHSLHRKEDKRPIICDQKTARDLSTGDVTAFTFNEFDKVKVIEVLGSIHDPHIFSLMAINSLGLPFAFSEEAEKLASKGKIPSLKGRVDLRAIPLVTIDGEDARDFDDAVFARLDDDPQNKGGWVALVAIADVAYYVRPGAPLDDEAYERGNSVYFPDRVVPMLPEALSNELCSLKPNVDRACLAVELKISSEGSLLNFHFMRGLMKSKARLTYHQVQNAIEGRFDALTEAIHEEIIQPLFGLYQCLKKARHVRGTIDFDMPEYQVVFDKHKRLSNIIKRQRLDSHQIIEELMITANVAAAKALTHKKWPGIYRIHEEPDPKRFDGLKAMLKAYTLGIGNPKKLTPSFFNKILMKVKDHPAESMINQLVLRCQSQARYGVEHDIGHFGLSLEHYTHFTSPIRRYSDLIVHRALIGALDLGEGGDKNHAPLEVLVTAGHHLSSTERKAQQAEREVMERYTAAWLSDKTGHKFEGQIVGVNRAGLFVGLNRWGAEGFVSIHGLEDDYYIYEEDQHRFVGRRSRRVFQLGQKVQVRLEVADPVSSSIVFKLIDEGRGAKRKQDAQEEVKGHEKRKSDKRDKKKWKGKTKRPLKSKNTKA